MSPGLSGRLGNRIFFRFKNLKENYNYLKIFKDTRSARKSEALNIPFTIKFGFRSIISSDSFHVFNILENATNTRRAIKTYTKIIIFKINISQLLMINT